MELLFAALKIHSRRTRDLGFLFVLCSPAISTAYNSQHTIFPFSIPRKESRAFTSTRTIGDGFQMV
jgi:hypothetical protein